MNNTPTHLNIRPSRSQQTYYPYGSLWSITHNENIQWNWALQDPVNTTLNSNKEWLLNANHSMGPAMTTNPTMGQQWKKKMTTQCKPQYRPNHDSEPRLWCIKGSMRHATDRPVNASKLMGPTVTVNPSNGYYKPQPSVHISVILQSVEPCRV